MKLPRWLVVSLLSTSALVVFACGAWWWTTWPERTARSFVGLVAASDGDKARELVDHRAESADDVHAWWIPFHTTWKGEPGREVDGEEGYCLKPLPRTLLDLVCGRQTFTISQTRIAAKRGKVVLDNSEYFWTKNIAEALFVGPKELDQPWH